MTFWSLGKHCWDDCHVARQQQELFVGPLPSPPTPSLHHLWSGPLGQSTIWPSWVWFPFGPVGSESNWFTSAAIPSPHTLYMTQSRLKNKMIFRLLYAVCFFCSGNHTRVIAFHISSTCVIGNHTSVMASSSSSMEKQNPWKVWLGGLYSWVSQSQLMVALSSFGVVPDAGIYVLVIVPQISLMIIYVASCGVF